MATPAPSQFAALLRRSKFASYDPHIGQVYTAFDGHAARGNFGLKRPLALRRRNAHITVQAVDSREQQTVWRSAESQNRWIRMWEEVGPKASMENEFWKQKVGTMKMEVSNMVDSEFAPAATPVGSQPKNEEAGEEREEVVVAEGVPRSHAVPNIDAMSEREFERYLKRLRELRPAFLEYVAQKHGTAAGGKEVFRRSINPGEDFKEFLQRHAYTEYHVPRPRFIEQQPHRVGGLSYANTPDVQRLYTTKPHIGRVLPDNAERHSWQVVSAGMVSKLLNRDRGLDEGDISTFRLTGALLRKLPSTAGPTPQGLEGTEVVTSIRVDSPSVTYWRKNPHIPGSKEYVGQTVSEMDSTTPVPDMTTPVLPKPDNFASNNVAAGRLLDALQTLSSPSESLSESLSPSSQPSS
ncbi:mitochondrial ribosomal protein subunit-domain-containing protein [Earliella scabrosa]|nr:mitochondrial ribosomal protein subunit-domain-containing protein [Earliella scabrosa]